MKKAIVIYGSTTGNTRTVADWIGDALSAAGLEVDVVDAAGAEPEQAAPYDLVVLGSSTWGQGELQDDFMGFYEDMSADELGGKKVAVFGCGDSGMFPDNFCEAVDSIEQKAKECGAEIVAGSFKIDGEIDGYQDKAVEWATRLAQI